MRLVLSIFFSIFLLIGQCLAEEKQETKTEAMSQKGKNSYSLGYKTGVNMKNSSADLDLDLFVQAFKEGFAGSKPAMTDQEMRETISALQKELKAKKPDKKKELSQKQSELAEKNKREGEAFMTVNAKKEGVVTLPSGLQYKVITEGVGKSPGKSDKVTVHYRGTLINGKEFDSSYKRKKPTTFSVDKVIKGWTEGLQLMKEGSKWMLYIPSDLAYGARGAGRSIGPNQTLIFEVDLMAVQPGGRIPDKPE
jgi:FKBP-type peptidyl-prolyl cis-trans isomerase FklB